MKKISLVVPCYNEEESIKSFYEEVDKVSKKIKSAVFEIIFINDGSKDKSINIMKELAKMDERVKYINFSKNFGKEAGIYAGFKNSTGEYVTIMDVDLQDPPIYLIDMFETLEKDSGIDVVALRSTNHEDYSFFRKIFTKVWYKIVDKFTNMNQEAGARDFRLMRRSVVDSIISMDEYNRYIKGIFGFVGFNTKWIEYKIPNRAYGESKFNLKGLFKYAINGILSFSVKPLMFSVYIGLILCLISFIAIIVIIVKTLIFGDPVSGWPSLACIVTFIGGIQLFFMGIFGMYLSRIYLEVKNRPIYIIKETNIDKEFDGGM